MSLPIAVCIIVVNPEGEVLACSRRNDHTAFGLPGGKVDPGETPEQAALREAAEETGYQLPIDTELTEVYRAVCEGDQDYDCVTFRVEYLDLKRATWIPTDPSEGKVDWVGWDVLARGPFAQYNQRVRELVS